MLVSRFIGPKILEIEFGQNVLLYTFSWPKRLWPKCPGQNIHSQNVLHSVRRYVSFYYSSVIRRYVSFYYSSVTLFPSGTLMISQLDLEHAGLYQCFVRNEAGEASKVSWLKVNSSPPELLTSPRNLSIIEGGDARFPCETRGAPKPVVTWSKGWSFFYFVLLQILLLFANLSKPLLQNDDL